MKKLRSINLLFAVLMVVSCFASSTQAQAKKPNIVVIMGDDIGMWNIGAYHRGMMAGRSTSSRFCRRSKRVSPLSPNEKTELVMTGGWNDNVIRAGALRSACPIFLMLR
ncbi:MAG: hypothetical protein ACYSWQ_20195 [Planctomycetota bacterium]|jgi:hypothetical protein